MTIKIEPTKELSLVELKAIVKDSKNQDILFVQRFFDNWVSQFNRFDREGEILLTAKDSDRVIGLCGLNIDPYCSTPIGRVRHLYVLSSYRRQGIGTRLIEKIIRQAKPHFTMLNLRTHNPQADKFYLARGFQRSCQRATCTHILKLT